MIGLKIRVWRSYYYDFLRPITKPRLGPKYFGQTFDSDALCPCKWYYYTRDEDIVGPTVKRVKFTRILLMWDDTILASLIQREDQSHVGIFLEGNYYILKMQFRPNEISRQLNYVT